MSEPMFTPESRRSTDRLAYAHDASHYLLVPEAVAKPTTAAEVAQMMLVSAAGGLPLTFRSAGTSLSGQAQSSGLMVDTRRHFRRIEVLDEGRLVRVQPGATVRQVNARLAPHGMKLGPDPASESACTIGGVIANNSSGMICGTEFNAYRTIESMILVLPSGNTIDTAQPDSDMRLRHLEPVIHGGLLALRDRVRGNPESVRIIQQQFSLKNTMGYGLNSFLDYSDPIDILTHLMVGSEGTLAFIAEATFRTIPIRPNIATGFLVFDNLKQATDSLPALVASGLAAIELLDETSLRVAQRDTETGPALPAIHYDHHAGLLIEYQEMTEGALNERVDSVQALLRSLPLVTPADLTTAVALRADLWHIRKGLYATVAGNRPSGTTALLEDIAVPVTALASTCQTLLGLFDRHGYQESVIFGHAKDGNIHFMINERFEDPASLARYTAFTDDMVDLVLSHHGTLKAEHGTGRIMAPFVRRQYGDELYEVMCAIKALIDPGRILNPGVLISDDPIIHVTGLKITPTVEAEVDRCVECGFCEPVCPSRDLTLTPRQRIVLRREMARAQAEGNTTLLAELTDEYEYEGIQTCAVDSMCQTACPVHIDTGDLIKGLRANKRKPVLEKVWGVASNHWAKTNATLGRVMTMASRMPAGVVTPINRAARRVVGADAVPLWDDGLPAGGARRRPRPAKEPVAVYFPSCVSTMFGPEPGHTGVEVAFLGLCSLAGIEVVIPAGIADACCGTPWKSKGMTTGYGRMHERVVPWLWKATEHGRLPVISDASSCTEGLHGMLAGVQARYGGVVKVVDVVDYTDEHLLGRLRVCEPLASLALHPTCSSTRLGQNPALLRVAGLASLEVVVAADWGCCGFAGDRGLLHPELTAAATAGEVQDLVSRDFGAYASCNRTCEIGMTRATGRPYEHILETLWRVVDRGEK